MTTALLLIDIQNDYFDGGKCPLVGMDGAAKHSVSLLDAFRESGLPVIHVRHEFPGTDAPFFAAGSEGALINPLLAPIEDEPVIVKHQINSFKGTSLGKLLEEGGVESVVIAGAMTHLCIDAVTRAAVDLGYACSVAHDACATMDAEFDGVKVEARQVHATVMAALDFGYAEVNATQTVMKGLGLVTTNSSSAGSASAREASFEAQ